MPIGEIFTGAFQRIWRHKKLWLLAMLGLALGALGSLVYSLLAARWMGSYFDFMNIMMRGGFDAPNSVMSSSMNSMTWIWAGGAVAGLFGLIGYIVNLVARGAIINEAAHAWRDQATDAGRGLRRGVQRGVYVFLLDLIWWVPVFLLILGGIVAFFVLVAGSAAASEANRAGALVATSWLAFLCGGACIGLLYYLVYAVFAPLMYQSAVAGDRDFGAALREGWRLARNNLGAMIVFWLLLLLVGLVLGAVVQAFSSLFSVPLWTSWFRPFVEGLQGLGDGAMPSLPRINGPLLMLVMLLSAGLSFLMTTFMQSLNLTVYAGVYQRLTGMGVETRVTGPDAPPPASAKAAPVRTVTPVPTDALIVEPPPPAEPEVPPTL
jgi:hypothetical protein